MMLRRALSQTNVADNACIAYVGGKNSLQASRRIWLTVGASGHAGPTHTSVPTNLSPQWSFRSVPWRLSPDKPASWVMAPTQCCRCAPPMRGSITRSTASQGLAEKKDKLGAPLCPCRHYDDEQAEADQGFWNCPCVPMRERKVRSLCS